MEFRAELDTSYPLAMNRWIIRDPDTGRIIWSSVDRHAVYYGARKANELSATH